MSEKSNDYPILGGASPQTASVADLANAVVDSAQSIKTFLKVLVDRGVDLSQNVLTEVNKALDDVIDEAQKHATG